MDIEDYKNKIRFKKIASNQEVVFEKIKERIHSNHIRNPKYGVSQKQWKKVKIYIR